MISTYHRVPAYQVSKKTKGNINLQSNNSLPSKIDTCGSKKTKNNANLSSNTSLSSEKYTINTTKKHETI